MASASLEHHADVSDDVSQQLTISAIAFSVICPLLVAARIFGRVKFRQQLGIDDVVIVLAVVRFCFFIPFPRSLSPIWYVV